MTSRVDGDLEIDIAILPYLPKFHTHARSSHWCPSGHLTCGESCRSSLWRGFHERPRFAAGGFGITFRRPAFCPGNSVSKRPCLCPPPHYRLPKNPIFPNASAPLALIGQLVPSQALQARLVFASDTAMPPLPPAPSPASHIASPSL